MKLVVALDANGNVVNNLPDAILPQQPVTLAQLNAAVAGYSWKSPVRAATTANITLSGAQTIDGVSIVAGDRVLVKSQTAGSGNGIYLASAGAWTRSTDFDAGNEALGAATFVSEGTTLGNTVWLQTTDAPITIGTTALVFTQIASGATYTAGNGILIVGGAITADPAVVARKASATIGDGSATTIAVTHNLNTQDVIVSVREVSTNAVVLADVVPNGVNTVQVTFSTAPTTGQYRVTVLA
ncbi:head decoration protein [Pseudomonas sp. CDFA 602]|uniref:head decoration protein n=1 Tax=Pseudomonas californiensis TaxID=2829823 RepID=UPI001E3A07D3|nr:head decoration protein [Pseudomonas californiensis]MCD5994136.1 head decoration protein [Pseudomonas californiensis]MCD5999765.1 head decoration protein [Pseudomonas californiensis]